MSYTDRKEMSASRAWSLALVFALHGFLLYWALTGGYQEAKKKLADLNVIDIKEPPPPPPEKPLPPPPKQDLPPPPVVSPPPIVQTNTAPPPQVTTVATPPPVFVPTPEPPRPAPPPPPPPPAAEPVKSVPAGNPSSWITGDDIPESVKRDRVGTIGRTAVRLTVNSVGRVDACQVTSGSGESALDDLACRLLTRRAKFKPGKDSSGNPVGGVFPFAFRWDIQ
jgi:periplasmic protein TonB